MLRLSCLPLVVLLAGCAVDVAHYTPPMDPALTSPATGAHLAYCRALVERGRNGSTFKTEALQAVQSSYGSWVSAIENWTLTSVYVAGAATAFGSVLGLHTDNTSRQADAESRVRQCLQNYHEPILEKP